MNNLSNSFKKLKLQAQNGRFIKKASPTQKKPKQESECKQEGPERPKEGVKEETKEDRRGQAHKPNWLSKFQADYESLDRSINTNEEIFLQREKNSKDVVFFENVRQLDVFPNKIFFLQIKWDNFVKKINRHVAEDRRFSAFQEYVDEFRLLDRTRQNYIFLNSLDYIQSKFISNYYKPVKMLSLYDIIVSILFQIVPRKRENQKEVQELLLTYLGRSNSSLLYIRNKFRLIIRKIRDERTFLLDLIYQIEDNLENIRIINTQFALPNTELKNKRIRFSVFIDLYILILCVKKGQVVFVEDYQQVLAMFEGLRTGHEFEFKDRPSGRDSADKPSVEQIFARNDLLFTEFAKYRAQLFEFEDLIRKQKIIENFIEFQFQSKKKSCSKIKETKQKGAKHRKPKQEVNKQQNSIEKYLPPQKHKLTNDSSLEKSIEAFLKKHQKNGTSLLKRSFVETEMGSFFTNEKCKTEDTLFSKKMQESLLEKNVAVNFDKFGYDVIKSKFEFECLDLEEFSNVDKSMLMVIVEFYERHPSTRIKANMLRRVLSFEASSIKGFVRNLEILNNFIDDLDLECLDEKVNMNILYFLYKSKKLISFIRKNFFKTVPIN